MRKSAELVNLKEVYEWNHVSELCVRPRQICRTYYSSLVTDLRLARNVDMKELS